MATSKTKTVWFCKACGNESPKWMGKCPKCGAWNSFVEDVIDTSAQAKTPAEIKRGYSIGSDSHAVPLDKLEAVIQHNESDISSWLPLEYELQLTYAYDRVQFSSYLKDLREAIRDETLNKIQTENNKTSE